jgi:carbamoyltransferase
VNQVRVLGITDGQTSGAAIVEDGRILAAVNEERIVRIKLARGFPRRSITEVMELTGTRAEDIDRVAVAQDNMEFREEVDGWPGWFEARDQDADVHSLFFKSASRFGSLVPRIPGLKQAYYVTRTPAYRRRRARIGQILRDEYDITARVSFVNHHYAHAAAAYLTSPFASALVVTMDGGGDGSCSHVYQGRDGQLTRLAQMSSYDSLGNYYAYVTALCGFKAKRHEGKITGLAALGEPIYRDLLHAMITVENGKLINKGQVLFNQALVEIRRRLPNDWKMKDLAASIQSLSEDLVREYVGHYVKQTGESKVAVAGGVFANVRINEEVHGIPGIDSVFVHPDMSDGGLAVGAALAVGNEHRIEAGRPYEPVRLDDVYLGPEFTDAEIGEELRAGGLRFEHLPGRIEPAIADHLADGKVVARFNGRMEYGPRALGNRSILYQPNDPSVNDWLNKLLRRTEFMPFAPSALWESADELFSNCGGSRETARFMTITFHCTPRMRERCSGVVHVDNTARPQLVRKEENASYWEIIEEYRRRTGTPAIINTSFNIHEEPIVRSPADAVRAFLDSRLDFLAVGDFLAEGQRDVKEVRRRESSRSSRGH